MKNALPALALMAALSAAHAGELKTVAAASASAAALSAYDGVVEALRQTTLAAQVPGAVVQLSVKPGDRVAAGQLLVQLDARAAAQTAQAGAAQVQAARAAQDVAARDFERQKALRAENFISAAALDRAEAEYRAATARSGAQIAEAGAALTQAGFYTLRAPFAGVVAEVPVTLGDMALPGKVLVTLYDPKALRVTAAVPQSVAARLIDGSAAPGRPKQATIPAGDRPQPAADEGLSWSGVRAELPTLPAAQRLQKPLRVQVLPAADAATHTLTMRADLAAGLQGLVPGQFARLWLPAGDDAPRAAAWVPVGSIVRRAEMTGLYVLDAQGRPLLRQVRLGRRDGERVEILAGLVVGERVVTDPQAAARTLAVK